MNTIKQDELFENVSQFFHSKGIELKDGLYTQRIRQACGLLGDAINATQRTASNAKAQVDKTLDQLRQTIHEATAPRPPVTPTPKGNGSAAEGPEAATPAAEPSPEAAPGPGTRKKKTASARQGSTAKTRAAASRPSKSKPRQKK